MRVAVVDMGTNSTRLLVADVRDGRVHELERRTTVTRLGEGVDASGRLAAEACERVLATLDAYVERIGAHGCDQRVAVMTSAVRDAANGEELAAAVRARPGFVARTLSGDEEARLTYRGATAARRADVSGDLLVVDVGGGSTELVVGDGAEPAFHVSTQVGVVRHTERHVRQDPPDAGELTALREDVRAELAAAVPSGVRRAVATAVAVAGTATSCAAIDQGLDPYDPERVEGYALGRGALARILARLAALPLAERRAVRGLHPDRAPTIVAGVVILLEVLGAFGLERCEASDRDILWGVALEAAALTPGSPAAGTPPPGP